MTDKKIRIFYRWKDEEEPGIPQSAYYMKEFDYGSDAKKWYYKNLDQFEVCFLFSGQMWFSNALERI